MLAGGQTGLRPLAQDVSFDAYRLRDPRLARWRRPCLFAPCETFGRRGHLGVVGVVGVVGIVNLGGDSLQRSPVQGRNRTRVLLWRDSSARHHTYSPPCHRQRLIQPPKARRARCSRIAGRPVLTLDTIAPASLVRNSSRLQFLLQTIGFRPLSKQAMKGLGAFGEFLVRTASKQVKHDDVSARLLVQWLREYRFAVTRYRSFADNCRRVQPADDYKSIPVRALRPRASRPTIGASRDGTAEHRKCR